MGQFSASLGLSHMHTDTHTHTHTHVCRFTLSVQFVLAAALISFSRKFAPEPLFTLSNLHCPGRVTPGPSAHNRLLTAAQCAGRVVETHRGVLDARSVALNEGVEAACNVPTRCRSSVNGITGWGRYIQL
jgi:hypothetical protein